MPEDFQTASLGTRVSKGKEKAEAARPRPCDVTRSRAGPQPSMGASHPLLTASFFAVINRSRSNLVGVV